jgi:hypothetical protein
MTGFEIFIDQAKAAGNLRRGLPRPPRDYDSIRLTIYEYSNGRIRGFTSSLSSASEMDHWFDAYC